MLRFHPARSGLCGVMRFVDETLNATWRLQTHRVRRGAARCFYQVRRRPQCRGELHVSLLAGQCYAYWITWSNGNWVAPAILGEPRNRCLAAALWELGLPALLTYANCSASWL